MQPAPLRLHDQYQPQPTLYQLSVSLSYPADIIQQSASLFARPRHSISRWTNDASPVSPIRPGQAGHVCVVDRLEGGLEESSEYRTAATCTCTGTQPETIPSAYPPCFPFSPAVAPPPPRDVGPFHARKFIHCELLFFSATDSFPRGRLKRGLEPPALLLAGGGRGRRRGQEKRGGQEEAPEAV